jgi:hypothetical protein
VHVEFKTEGGFAALPGLRKPVMIDSDGLAPAEAVELARLVQATHFFDLPAQVNAPAPGAADYQRYTITVVDGTRCGSISVVEPVDNVDLRALLTFLQTQARAQRRGATGT